MLAMMVERIVPARREYVTGPQDLKEGQTYHVDSGMGGSFEVEYVGRQGVGGRYRFRNMDGEYSVGIPCLDVEEEMIAATIYRLVAA